MRIWRSFVVVFSMYSRIPMPRVEWDEESMRYALCWLPFIGLVAGGLNLGWLALASRLGFGPLLCGVVAALLPIAVSGAIHLDGFCDTVDALSSHRDRAKKLEILKDSHVGAFAVIGCACYLLLSAGLWSEISFSARPVAALGLGFCLSRALSGFAAVSWRSAKRDGTLAAFAQAAQQRTVRIVLFAQVVLYAVGMVLLSPLIGSAGVAAALAVFGYYRVMSTRQFGGLTGDLAGYFLTLCELAIVAAAVICKGVTGWF